jgi:hypothetical protein
VTVRDDVEAERAMLADSLEAVGPQARTACGDWTAFDLAAHVVAGERGPERSHFASGRWPRGASNFTQSHR